MSVNKLKDFFSPKRIALIGASINPNSVSGRVLLNIIGGSFKGVVYPVNPAVESVMGVQCYKDITAVPKVPDLAIICSSTVDVPLDVKNCGDFGIRNLIIMTAGFRETGEEGAKLEHEISELIKAYEGMRVLGPNCLGIIVPGSNLNLSFASSMPTNGNIAFISQSGALCTSVLDWAKEKKIGFSHFISVGNAIDIDYPDLIDYLGEDKKTSSIILYIESIKNARKFMTSARSFARTKPIIAFKSGRSQEAAKVAASHTGAMAAEDSIFDAAFKRMGVTRVFDIEDIFDTVELIGRNKIPKGSRLGIITNAGGPGVIAVDMLIDKSGTLAELQNETLEKLNAVLPKSWSGRNPVDVLGDANSKRIAKAIQILIEDKCVDAILVIITPQAMTNPTAVALEISKISENTSKPIIAAFMGGEMVSEGIKILRNKNIPVYLTPEQAVRSFMTLVSYSRNLEILYETPKDIDLSFSNDRKKIKKEILETFSFANEILSEKQTKEILSKYEIPVTMPISVRTTDDLKNTANKIGYPLVMKIDSPFVTHKSDIGGVILNIEDEEMLLSSYNRMIRTVTDKNPDLCINGVTLQRMIRKKDSIEMILGIKKDNTFGTVIMAGMGGTGAELFNDRSIGFPPLNERLAIRMLESLKIYPLLKGYRGSLPVDINKLIEILIRISYLASDYPEIKELDINPLLVWNDGAAALDARVLIDKDLVGNSSGDYSHLAIKPYPEEYVKNVILRNNESITLRPIKPEDEYRWIKMLSSCSKESIYSRFRYFFDWSTHDVAVRYCYIDYDRELAIVAEIKDKVKNENNLIGIGRLIADPEHETVEYAILISDKWQNKDLGGIITDYCFEIAKKWGLKKIVAQTTSDNQRMISVFKKRGFKIDIDPHSSLVEVEKELN